MKLRIGRWRHPDWQAHLWGLLQGVAEIADGVVTLCSLGFLASNFEMRVSWHRALGWHKRNKKRAER